MTSNWIAQTWDRVHTVAPMHMWHDGRLIARHSDEFRRAVDTWLFTCEIILAQAPAKHQGKQWDNRR